MNNCDSTKKIALGDQGEADNTEMFLSSFGGNTYEFLLGRKLIAKDEKKAVTITDLDTIRLLFVLQAVTDRFGIRIPYKWLIKMEVDESYMKFWEEQPDFYEFDNAYDAEIMLEIYRRVSYVEYEKKRRKNTLLYELLPDGNIIEYKIVETGVDTYTIKQVDNPDLPERKLYINRDDEWYTRRGAVRNAMSRIETIRESVSKYSEELV